MHARGRGAARARNDAGRRRPLDQLCRLRGGRGCVGSRGSTQRCPRRVLLRTASSGDWGACGRAGVSRLEETHTAMRSASSTTTILMWLRSTVPCSMRSSSRPGVATRTSTPLRSAPSVGRNPLRRRSRRHCVGRFRERRQFSLDLLGQLPGRAENQRSRPCRSAFGMLVRSGKPEGKGLSGPRRCFARYVSSRQSVRDGGRLHGNGSSMPVLERALTSCLGNRVGERVCHEVSWPGAESESAEEAVQPSG